MAHEADGGVAVIVLGGRLGDGVGHRLEVPITGQQGRAYRDMLKGVGVLGQLVHQVRVLQAVHQVGGLDHQRFDAVVHRPVQGRLDIVDLHAVPLPHPVNDDLAGEGPADRPVREGLRQGRFNGADGQAAAVVVAGAEADHQQLLLPDLVLIAGVVQAGVSGVHLLRILGEIRGRAASDTGLGPTSGSGRGPGAAGGQRGHQQRRGKQQGQQFLDFHDFSSFLLDMVKLEPLFVCKTPVFSKRTGKARSFSLSKRAKGSPKQMAASVQSIPRDLEVSSRTHRRQVSWLTDPHISPPSQFSSVAAPCVGDILPAYSDEIAQVLHLFPF